MKIAKLEIKMILALVLCRYDYQLVDGSGKPAKPPQVNMNDNHQVWLWFDPIVTTYSSCSHILEKPYGRAVFYSVQESRGIRWEVMLLTSDTLTSYILCAIDHTCNSSYFGNATVCPHLLSMLIHIQTQQDAGFKSRQF